MNNICIRNRDDMYIINSSNINKEALFDIFCVNVDEIIYITEYSASIMKECLVGIITLGDYRRSILNGTDMVNRKFTSAQDLETAQDILNKRENIRQVPIVDENFVIMEECYQLKEKSQEPEVSIEVLSEIYCELDYMQSSYAKIIFVVNKTLLEKWKKAGKEILDEQRVLVENSDLATLEHYLQMENVAVCDFCEPSYALRKIFYQKYRIENILWEYASNDLLLKKCIQERGTLYNQISLMEESTYLENILSNRELHKFSPKECEWNKAHSCYEYNEEICTLGECIFVLVCFWENPYIVVNNRYIPMIAMKHFNIFMQRKMACVDIATNIIPTLQSKKVNYLIINNPDNEYEKIKETLEIDIRTRGRIDLLRQKELIAKFIGEDDDEVVNELMMVFKGIMKNGFTQVADIQGKYVNFVNGERYTSENPVKYENVIYLFGPCIVRGGCVRDEYTLGSCLRQYISDRYYIKNCGNDWLTENYVMRNNRYKEGDLVIAFSYDKEYFEREGIDVYSVIEAYKRVKNLSSHVWENLLHCNKVVMKSIAKEIYKICLSKKMFYENIEACQKKEYLPDIAFGIKRKMLEIPVELEEWINKMEQYKVKNVGKAGAIVMNCNPFTLGHRYLIETAAKSVDVLYIFVVEEDKSFFKFQDRIKMVRLGTKDMNHVVVVPSGKYMISTETLPGYFNKEQAPSVAFDATDDLEIFATVIAKRFNITIRFAGEEPTDPFTKRYNEFMQRILPENGVEFCEIPRKMVDNEQVISASLVRKYLNNNEWDKIKNLVLPVIYEYLEEHYRFD